MTLGRQVESDCEEIKKCPFSLGSGGEGAQVLPGGEANSQLRGSDIRRNSGLSEGMAEPGAIPTPLETSVWMRKFFGLRRYALAAHLQ